MQILSPEQKLQIARCVHETFDRPSRWQQQGWGRDDEDVTIEFDGTFYIVEEDSTTQAPMLRFAIQNTYRCLCLSAAIGIHTGLVLSHHPLPAIRTSTEFMCAVYTKCAGINPAMRDRDAENVTPHMSILSHWNDANERSFKDIRQLTASALRELDVPQN